jgi:excinuclease UvrABC helicase subunit UvrB
MTKENNKFKLVSKYKPAGSQPEAIKALTEGLKNKLKFHIYLYIV